MADRARMNGFMGFFPYERHSRFHVFASGSLAACLFVSLTAYAGAGDAVQALPASVDAPTFSFKPLPYDDDYRYFQDQRRRVDWWSRLKGIPVGEAFFSIGGDVRLRSEYSDHYGFGRGVEDPGTLWMARSRLWGELRINENIRLFGELKSSLTEGADIPRSAVAHNTIDTHQAFIEVVGHAGEDGQVMARIGRQELLFGEGRIIDVRNGPNSRRTFDVARAEIGQGNWSAGAIAGHVVADEPGPFNDSANNDWNMAAAHLTYAYGQGKDSSENELLYVRTDRDTAPLPEFRGERNTLSLRRAGTAPHHDYDLELVGQTGSTEDGRRVRAWFVGLVGGYTFDGPLKPRLGVRADIGSGDRNAGDRTVQGYDHLWPHGMTYTTELGYTNLMSVGPSLGWKYPSGLALQVSAQGLWRTSLEDGLYTMAGVRIREAQEGDARYVGTRMTLSADYRINRQVSLGAYVNRTKAGPFLKQTGDADSLLYANAFMSFRF